ncbi:trk system potassium uptake protein TrkH [Desulfobaculum xiamenense]|uniref:Trk system potassium uptake protein TrkH n=1 Tax=Desulfobaculum xiamenense TaxID=995050 RepID=A0A846QEH9_9BACT|nr:TrkH family potassium uptake protein [Desulfobaculum xiamenense]NJB66768.1 trk system potassium uptake protein TrkH [Desulfobaculum xiamenense]
MRWRYTLHVVGAILVSMGLSMLFALGFSLYYNDAGVEPLVASISVAVVFGAGLFYMFRDLDAPAMNHREGMAIVALGWIAAGIVGALPFWFAGTFPTFTDCVFESVSGFTTTGASVLTDIESVPRGLLMWRSLTHWLGGMGIIVLSLAILPFLGVGGMQLYKAEVPGPVPDKLKPRIKDTAMLLWKVYVFFTVVEVLLLLIGGMDLFESLCHTFGTMATGGFSTRNTSIAAYDSVYFDVVITVFMLIAGVNFSLHYQLLRGRPLVMWRDAEFRFFMGVFAVFTLVCAFSVWGRNYDSFFESLRYAAFQVASIVTTTGYATADYELWAPLPQAMLLLLMFLGGCAGSTGGGIKCMRILLLLKHTYKELYRLIHPRAVTSVKLGGKTVPPEVMNSITGFFLLFLGLFIVSSFGIAAMGMDVVTSFASVVACIGNIGPGLGTVGPTENYAHFPLLGKWLLVFCMLLGRLEIYTVIILFIPEFWRK